MLDSLEVLSTWLADCLELEGWGEERKLCNQLCKRLLRDDVATKMLR